MRSVVFQVEVANGVIDLGSGLVVDNLTGVVAHPDRLHLKTTANLEEAIIELELIKIGSELFILNPFSEQWQPLPPGSSTLESLDPFAAADVFGLASGLTRVGRGRLGDLDAWQISGILTPEALVPLLGTSLGERPIKSEMWIGVEDGLPHEIRLTIESASGDPLMVKISLSEFDRPVTIERP